MTRAANQDLRIYFNFLGVEMGKFYPKDSMKYQVRMKRRMMNICLLTIFQ